MKTTATEKETQMFWRVCQHLKSTDQQIVADALDELDVLRDYTDCPTLKDQCTKMIERVAARAAAEPDRKVLG